MVIRTLLTGLLAIASGAPASRALVPDALGSKPLMVVATSSAAQHTEAEWGDVSKFLVNATAAYPATIAVASAEEQALTLGTEPGGLGSAEGKAALAAESMAIASEQAAEAVLAGQWDALRASQERERPVAPETSGGRGIWRDYVISDRVPHMKAELLNPAMLVLPPRAAGIGSSATGGPASQAGGAQERYLVAMRWELHGSRPMWPGSSMRFFFFESSVELGWLAPERGELKLQGAMQKITDESLFPGAPFDCLQQCPEKLHYCFGLEDPRLVWLRGERANEPDGEPFLLLHTRAHFAQSSNQCRSLGDEDGAPRPQQEEGLQPYMLPLKLHRDGSVRPLRERMRQLHSADESLKLKPVEKNWVLFPCGGGTCIVYAVHPRHVILSLNASSGAVVPCANTSASALPAGESWHGGAGAVLLGNATAGEGFFLSAVHGKSYTTYLYKFRAAHPHDILAVATVPLPLKQSSTSWGGMVSFVSSLALGTDDAGEPELIVGYGSGDFEARVFTMPLALLDQFNFTRRSRELALSA